MCHPAPKSYDLGCYNILDQEPPPCKPGYDKVKIASKQSKGLLSSFVSPLSGVIGDIVGSQGKCKWPSDQYVCQWDPNKVDMSVKNRLECAAGLVDNPEFKCPPGFCKETGKEIIKSWCLQRENKKNFPMLWDKYCPCWDDVPASLQKFSGDISKLGPRWCWDTKCMNSTYATNLEMGKCETTYVDCTIKNALINAPNSEIISSTILANNCDVTKGALTTEVNGAKTITVKDPTLEANPVTTPKEPNPSDTKQPSLVSDPSRKSEQRRDGVMEKASDDRSLSSFLKDEKNRIYLYGGGVVFLVLILILFLM